MDKEKVSLPRLVIAAPQGRSGKTTVTLGICAALAARGLAVQPFKKGPDYIDPSWLSEAAGRPCRSLDPFFLASPGALEEAFVRGAALADLSILEGNHGLYDSQDPEGKGSTASVARLLGAPILLVVNAARMSRSAAAMVHGYQIFEAGTHIAGVILNNVAGSQRGTGRHEAKLRQAIESYCQIPVIGALPRDETLSIPDRHLGLVPRGESEASIPAIEACRRAAEEFIDLDSVVSLANSAPPVDAHIGCASETGLPETGSSVVIGVIRDRVFSFYYPENFEALQEAGARLVFIDSLHDAQLPRIDALYIGGGFPEIFMEELSANREMLRSIRAAIEQGLPVYAECGGLMYLSRKIHWDGRSAEMVGALPCTVEMTTHPQGHGYVLAETLPGNPFFQPGCSLRGHEFHHSRLVNMDGDLPTAYQLLRGNGFGNQRDGVVYGSVLASYTHLHAGGSPEWAPSLVGAARRNAEANGHG